MNYNRRLYLRLWRINSQLAQTWWWIALTLMLGSFIGRSIGTLDLDHKDIWQIIGMIGGFLIGLFISFRLWKRTPEYKISCGDDYLLQKKYENAIEMYTQAITSLPRYPITFMRRAIAYHSSGGLPQALSDYSKAIDLKSNFAQAYYYRALVYWSMEDFARAEADLTVAINLNMRTAETYMGRAGVQYKLGKLDLALSDLTYVIRYKPKSANAYYLYGKIYQDKNMPVEAVTSYQKALALEPQHNKVAEMRQSIEKLSA